MSFAEEWLQEGKIEGKLEGKPETIENLLKIQSPCHPDWVVTWGWGMDTIPAFGLLIRCDHNRG